MIGLTQEAQQSLEGYLHCKTMLVSETAQEWTFSAEEGRHFQVRKMDGAMFHQHKLMCLLAIGEEHFRTTNLLLRLLKRFPDGVELVDEDDTALYMNLYQISKRKKFSQHVRVVKNSGFVYAKTREGWAEKPMIAS